jgi:hypothetical protein
MAQAWRATLRENFNNPSKHGVAQPWSPAGKNEGWRDYEKYAPELREYNEQKKAIRSKSRESRRSRSRSSSRRVHSRSASPAEVNALGAHSSEGVHSDSWRLSFRVALSKNTKAALKHQPLKHVGHLPVFSGMATFTLRNMGITHLHGMGVHPEVTKIFLQQNFLTSFEGWEHQPHLTELHAADNLIESFK